MTSEACFRVIVVGGGLVGLTAAHILAKADIDFVVLEQHASISPYLGSLLSIMPTTGRVYDQIGIWEPMSKVFDQAEHAFIVHASDGSLIREEHKLLSNIGACCGHSVGLSHRTSLTEALYMNLPETAKSRILLNKRVADIVTRPDGVEVICDDKSVEKGSMIIGADGVRSKVRGIMNKLRANGAGSTEEHERTPYVSTYRDFYGDIPVLPGLVPGSNYEGVHDGVSTQILVGSTRSWFNVYEKLEAPTSDHVRYSEKDQMQLLEKWGHLYMAPGYQLRDVYQRRTGHTGLINLEEGLVTDWSWQRIVLVGDAVRKLTPNAGWGYNMGVSDIVVLVNNLRSLLTTTEDPDTEALAEIFREYQILRKADTLKTHELSMERIRTFAWLSWKPKFIVKYILPLLSLGTFQWNMHDQPLHSRGPVLYWLPETKLPRHKSTYQLYPPFELTSKQFKSWRNLVTRKSNSNSMWLLLLSFFVICLGMVGAQYLAGSNMTSYPGYQIRGDNISNTK